MSDLIGKTFGKLTVISVGPTTKLGVRRWISQCSCGNKVLATKYNLTHGISRSCGCLGRENNLVGRKFGKLTVIQRAENIEIKKAWLCQCDCGNQTIVKSNHLKTSNTMSCGCLKKITDYKNLKGRKRKIYEKKDVIKKLYHDYKKSADRRHLDFALTFDIFDSIISKNCYYCGIPPQNKIRYSIFSGSYNGIDRKDNKKGYTEDNCVPCCFTCNSAKRNHSVKDFKEWAYRLGTNIKNSPNFLQYRMSTTIG